MVQSSKTSACKGSDVREEDKLIAVIVIETFDDCFQPQIKYDPLALLSLVNSPLIDYSLDWLQRCEIDEVIVYCCAQPHSETIRTHCKEWCLRNGNSMKVNVTSSENCTSLGDAMRDIYSKALLKNDFILMTGAVIGNLDLKAAMKKYKSAFKKDQNCVLSCVYLKTKPQDDVDRNRVANLVVNSKNGKILSHSRPGKSTKFALKTEIIQSASKLTILPKLSDPSLAICSQMIPSLFSDNFDYATRDNLVQGLIEQEELLGCTVHSQVLDEGYAAVVSSFKAYEEISNAVIRREVFPFVAERSLSSQRIRYIFQSFSGSYWDSSAKFHKISIGKNVVIDAGCEIDQRSSITNSVIGKHCSIKENVTIKNSFIMSNVTINKGCILESCFIGSDVKLLAGVHLEPGSIIGSRITLGPNLKVNRCTRLSDEPVSGEFGAQSSDEVNPLVCGKEGRAFVYSCLSELETNEDDITTRWGEEEKLVDSEEEEEDSEDEDESEDEELEPEEGLSSDEEREQEFEREVKDSLLNALQNNSALENVILEINASRHAYNVSMENVLMAVTKETLTVVEANSGSSLTGEKLWQSIKQGLNTFGDLIKNYIKKPKDQIVVLNALEDAANEEARFLPTFQRIVYEMSQELDILDDEVILFWFSKQGFHTDAFPVISKSIEKFIDWLKLHEGEEETDSDDDDD